MKRTSGQKRRWWLEGRLAAAVMMALVSIGCDLPPSPRQPFRLLSVALPERTGTRIVEQRVLIDGKPRSVRCKPEGILCSIPGAELFRARGRSEFRLIPPDFQRARRALSTGLYGPGCVESLCPGLPIRDRSMHSQGLRSRHVAGLRTFDKSTVYWYGAAMTGATIRSEDRGEWKDILTTFYVHDLDRDTDGSLWAATDQGLVRVPETETQSVTVVAVPHFAPGNALDGIFDHRGLVHVFGPAGLFRFDPTPSVSKAAVGPGPKGQTTGQIAGQAAGQTAGQTMGQTVGRLSTEGGEWTSIVSGPVLEARSTTNGITVLTDQGLRILPERRAVGRTLPAAITHFAYSSPTRLVLSTPMGLYSFADGQRVPMLETILPVPPAHLTAERGRLFFAGSGTPGGLWTAWENGQRLGPALSMDRFECSARCVLVEDRRVLIGTADGLASLEGGRIHWYYHRSGLEVTALDRVDRLYVLATSEGLLVLDGPVVVARHGLGSGGGPGRVTALLVDGSRVWATATGLGLWRFAIERVRSGLIDQKADSKKVGP